MHIVLQKAVAIVGVGRMGANMATRLHDVAYRVTAVYDVDHARASAVAGQIAAHAPQSLSEVTALADIIFTVVTDDAAMDTVFAEKSDSLLSNANGKIFINCATVSPHMHLTINARAAAAGAKTLEACMASSITQAREGTLFLICGGEQSTFDAVKPVLDALGSSRFVGEAGRAAQIKALVNMLMNINTAALAEALGLGASLGLDLELLSDIFAHTGAKSRVLETDGADMLAREHDVYFSAEHAAKDSGIALALTDNNKLDFPLARITKQRYDELVALGFGQSDKSAIAELTFPGRAADAKIN